MHNRMMVWATFLGALILTLLPMPEWAVWIRPAWVLLVLVYWNMTYPEQISLGSAWILGIILDVLTGSLLGEHAFALTVASYFVVKMHARLRMFSLLQQGLCVFLLVLLYQMIIYCILGFINALPTTKLYWASSVISMLLWPWIVTILRHLHYRYKLA